MIALGQVIGKVTELSPEEAVLPGDESGKPTLCLRIAGEVNASAGLREDFHIVRRRAGTRRQG